MSLDGMTVEELLARYCPMTRVMVKSFLDKLARTTRKRGQISEQRKLKILSSFAAYDTDVVIAALKAYMDMDIPAASGGGGKNEKYVLGIMRNKQKEKNGKRSGKNVGHGLDASVCMDERTDGAGAGAEGEGERLHRLADGSSGSGSLECDF